MGLNDALLLQLMLDAAIKQLFNYDKNSFRGRCYYLIAYYLQDLERDIEYTALNCIRRFRLN
jgi:hypothetical protein